MIQSEGISKILVVKPSSLGDIVQSLPLLGALKGRFPKARVDWVVAEGLHGLLEGHPMIERLWIIRKDRWKDLSRAGETLREIKTLLMGLRREGYDLAVDLQGLLRSGIMTWATKAPLRVGFMEAREGSTLFYTHKVEGGREIHAVERYLRVASFMGCRSPSLEYPFPPLPSVEQMGLPAEYAVIVPGAKWPKKRWPPERFGELASRLPVKSVVVGGSGDARLSEAVVNNSGGKALSLTGRTSLKQLVGVIKGARFMVSNDTGPMHIAAALNVPVFALFGPTNPVRTGPYGNIHTVIREDLPCSPCYRKRCADVRCMEEISAGRVLEAVLERTGLSRST